MSCASSGHTTNLKQSILELSISMTTKQDRNVSSLSLQKIARASKTIAFDNEKFYIWKHKCNYVIFEKWARLTFTQSKLSLSRCHLNHLTQPNKYKITKNQGHYTPKVLIYIQILLIFNTKISKLPLTQGHFTA